MMNFENYIRLKTDDSELIDVLKSILESIKKVAASIDLSKEASGEVNVSGDTQLAIDLLADIIIHDSLLDNRFIALLASEEREEEIILNGSRFSVAYDPLDGSSLVDVNFAVGSIFGIYDGSYLIGKTGRDLVSAVYAVYGPKTSVVMSIGVEVFELLLEQDEFVVSRESLKIEADCRYFAPGNLKEVAINPKYRKMLDSWIDRGLTLRYSGGMVPDLNHIFLKGSGIFVYPTEKLRLLYECAPMAFLVEKAFGQASNGKTAILDLPIVSLHQKTALFIGSAEEVKTCQKVFFGYNG